MLLAWNTTQRLNWGARGAHAATYQLLSEAFEEVERLSGLYQTKSYPINYTLPDRIAYPLSRQRDRFLVAKVYDKLERLTGGQWDYLSNSPQTSAERVIQNKDKKYFGGLVDKVENSEKVVVDGNGDMIFKSSPKRNLIVDLVLVELASKLGKEVFYVNSVFADGSVTERNEVLAQTCLASLRKCRAVAFRDPTSLQLSQQMDASLDAQWIPDSLFYWYDYFADSRSELPRNGSYAIPFTQEDRIGRHKDLDLGGSYICVTGGSGAAMTPEKASRGYSQLVNQLQKLDPPVYLVPTCSGDSFLYDVADETQTPIVPAEVPILMGGALLANARVFVTGRYHPAIMAASGGTPCVFLGADSHKTRSLQQLLEYEHPQVYSAVPSPDEQNDILEQCRTLLRRGQEARDRVQHEAAECARQVPQLAALIKNS
jgi:hypothetical protein